MSIRDQIEIKPTFVSIVDRKGILKLLLVSWCRIHNVLSAVQSHSTLNIAITHVWGSKVAHQSFERFDDPAFNAC